MTYAPLVLFSCLLHSELTNQRFKFSVNPEPLNGYYNRYYAAATDNRNILIQDEASFTTSQK